MIESLARRYLDCFLRRERVVHRLFPLGIGVTVAGALLLPPALVLLVLVVLLFWTMHLEAEIQETLLPEGAHLDAIAYRGSYYFVLTAMGCLTATHLAILHAGVEEPAFAGGLPLVVAILALAVAHTAARSVEIADMAERYLATRSLDGGAMIVMRSPFSRWLTNGRVVTGRRHDDL